MFDEKTPDPKAAVKAELRQWNWHPRFVRDLIIHSLIQTVKDAQRIATGTRLTGVRNEDSSVVVDKLKHWTECDRFEFWVEVVDIDSACAREAIKKIAEGEREVDESWHTTVGN